MKHTFAVIHSFINFKYADCPIELTLIIYNPAEIPSSDKIVSEAAQFISEINTP